jgi:(2Fe-2S) ferredoxin
LQAAVRREASRLGLNLQTAKALTLCDGTCLDGPFVGLPQLGLFYRGIGVGEARRMLVETALEGRLLFRRLYLDPTVVTDSRLVFQGDQNLLIAMEEDYCLVGLVAYLFEFNAAESCGKCFPCRLGVHRLERLLRSLMAGQAQEKDLASLEEVAWTMALTGYCQFARRVTAPLRLALRLSRGEFENHVKSKGCRAQERFLMPSGSGLSGPAGGEP